MNINLENVKYVIDDDLLNMYGKHYCKDIIDRINDEKRLKILKRDLWFLHKVTKMMENKNANK